MKKTLSLLPLLLFSLSLLIPSSLRGEDEVFLQYGRTFLKSLKKIKSPLLGEQYLGGYLQNEYRGFVQVKIKKIEREKKSYYHFYSWRERVSDKEKKSVVVDAVCRADLSPIEMTKREVTTKLTQKEIRTWNYQFKKGKIQIEKTEKIQVKGKEEEKKKPITKNIKAKYGDLPAELLPLLYRSLPLTSPQTMAFVLFDEKGERERVQIKIFPQVRFKKLNNLTRFHLRSRKRERKIWINSSREVKHIEDLKRGEKIYPIDPNDRGKDRKIIPPGSPQSVVVDWLKAISSQDRKKLLETMDLERLFDRYQGRHLSPQIPSEVRRRIKKDFRQKFLAQLMSIETRALFPRRDLYKYLHPDFFQVKMESSQREAQVTFVGLGRKKVLFRLHKSRTWKIYAFKIR